MPVRPLRSVKTIIIAITCFYHPVSFIHFPIALSTMSKSREKQVADACLAYAGHMRRMLSASN